ncbi:hypothetical protein [Rhizobium sp. S9]|uniref:hypothetical protein n=1 Tax=Rhizobium sp. S9 TaxID=2035454 RepID=UPI001144617A|nr:hypothetical protein [Rhizobium sp. S9]
MEVASSNDDDEERRASAWLSYSARQRLSAIEGQLAARKQEMALGIDRYARVQDGWFLRYEPDEDTTAYYRHLAEIYSAGTAEANALPEDTLLGGRTFRSWNALSITAYGRVLHHIACATRLMATRPNLELRNLLTAFAHKEDVKALWQQAGESASSADQVVAGLSLNADTAAICEHNHEQPLPYYIEFGRNFVLLPIFGGMLNASAGLTWHLRAAFRRDWDKAVDGRERVFRDNLRDLFKPPRYTVPDRGFHIKRSDGTELTDIDAVALDNVTGRLCLIQLKWPDIYGRSVTERNSRRINLLKANDWVARISDWVGGRSSSDVCRALGLGNAGSPPPAILVLARHVARFSGESNYDSRALWESWPRLVKTFYENQNADIFHILAHTQRSGTLRRDPAVNIYELPGLTVEVRFS